MEFQEFVKERDRMCNEYSPYCYENCPLGTLHAGATCKLNCMEKPQEAEQIVEQWAKDHPIVTNGQKFHEIMMETFGQTYLCRAIVANTSGGEHGISYTDDWWNAEYQTPKGEEG